MSNSLKTYKLAYTAEEAQAKLEADLAEIEYARSCSHPSFLETVLMRLQAEKAAFELHALLTNKN